MSGDRAERKEAASLAELVELLTNPEKAAASLPEEEQRAYREAQQSIIRRGSLVASTKGVLMVAHEPRYMTKEEAVAYILGELQVVADQSARGGQIGQAETIDALIADLSHTFDAAHPEGADSP